MTTGSALLTLEDAYSEALQGWPADAFEEVLGSDGEFDDDGVDQHARARVEDASPYGLVGRLEGAASGAIDPSSLAAILDLVRAADRLTSWAAAQRARLVARVHTFSNPDHHSWSGSASSLAFTETVAETAALLTMSEGSAARLVSESLALTGDLTTTLAALEKGTICPGRASVIVEQSRTLPDEAVPAFETEILKVAGSLNRPKLTARCRRLREKLHPETLTVRRVRAAADRCVAFEPDRDGMAWFSAYLPAEQALALHTSVDAVARTLRSGDDPRTLPQLRADVLADMLLGAGRPAVMPSTNGSCRCGGSEGRGAAGSNVGQRGAAGSNVGQRGAAGSNVGQRGAAGSSAGQRGAAGSSAGQGVRPSTAKIVVTVPVFSLMGLTEEPAELEGYGPIPADAARHLAADATSWMRLLTHPYTGAVLGLDRTRYRPSEDLRTWVQLREKTCSFYGCSRPASRCDLDHLVSWADDGSTSADNLYPACKRHHMMKHRTDWTPMPNPGGGLSWLSPGGRTYTTPPEPPPGDPHSSATARILHELETAMRTGRVPDAEALPPF
ncbi:HNH endonuclease signature motif containing protein [Arthrobacter sp. SX1312]|uniref:HNH endonuclease signature motif containing protein n=1 Tax=Arthrobacter sp. SX1312 TaxID=2058896 RepID=UPI000CE519C6|nr:HNH endonuclease signature motif containing protein [Arthrobacter sp. SX1312]